jgi:hypothetical protein
LWHLLNQQRNLVGQRNGNGVAQTASLAEVDKVLKREGKGDGLLKLNGGSKLGLLNVGVLAEGDSSLSDVSGAGELDSLLGGLNCNYPKPSVLFDLPNSYLPLITTGKLETYLTLITNSSLCKFSETPRWAS